MTRHPRPAGVFHGDPGHRRPGPRRGEPRALPQTGAGAGAGAGGVICGDGVIGGGDNLGELFHLRHPTMVRITNYSSKIYLFMQ